jgi:hypothetical protein
MTSVQIYSLSYNGGKKEKIVQELVNVVLFYGNKYIRNNSFVV